MKDKITELLRARKLLAQQMPDAVPVLTGSLMSRMIRCNKPGCRHCQKGKGQGHGPIWILAISQGQRRTRQIPVPAELKKDVEEGLQRFSQIQILLKRIAAVNQTLLEERKRQ